MRTVRVCMLATSVSLGAAACGSESTPPPAKVSKSTEVGGNPSSPNSSPSSTVKNQAAIVKLSATNIRLNYEVTTQYGATKGKESEIVAISKDTTSYRVSGTGGDGRPDYGYAKVTSSNGGIFCQKTCEPIPTFESSQLRKITIPQFVAPLAKSSLSGFIENPTITPAPDETIHGIETKCITFSGTILNGTLIGKRCAAINGGFLAFDTEKTAEGTTTYELQSARPATAADFPSH